MKELAEGIDYYFNEEGLLVMTGKYLLERGNCCGFGCKHCPFEYINVPEPNRTFLKQKSPDGENNEPHRNIKT